MSKTIAEKMYIKPDTTLWAEPADRLDLIGSLPDGVETVDSPGDATNVLLFADDEAGLRGLIARHGGHLPSRPNLWIAYPKGNRTDINRDTLWPIMMELNLRGIGQIAVDDVWSAMRFRPLRPGEVPGGQGSKESK